MDSTSIGGGVLPGSTAGILGLEPSLHRRHHHLSQHPPNPSMTLFDPSNGHHASSINPFSSKAFCSSLQNPSDDEDDAGHGEENDHGNGSCGSKPKKGSPWHRMKWTDDMVRLLITIVSYIGDDADLPDCSAQRRKPGAPLQKKGKWKTVSKLMLEKGCYVSPQQCEDKFNDLNKRYKRLNEILGRGTTCMVVENPILLETMHHLPPKSKEDVKKILSSKHLFYREMCAYHNGQRISNCQDVNLQAASARDGNGCEEEDEDDDDDDENGEDEERIEELGKMGLDGFRAEINGVLQDTTKSKQEQQEWFKKRALQLMEERVEICTEAFELEKRRFKWQRFSNKKDREMESLRLENERLRLENERMMMQVRQKELEMDLGMSVEPVESSGLWLDVEHGRDRTEMGRVL